MIFYNSHMYNDYTIKTLWHLVVLFWYWRWIYGYIWYNSLLFKDKLTIKSATFGNCFLHIEVIKRGKHKTCRLFPSNNNSDTTNISSSKLPPVEVLIKTLIKIIIKPAVICQEIQSTFPRFDFISKTTTIVLSLMSESERRIICPYLPLPPLTFPFSTKCPSENQSCETQRHESHATSYYLEINFLWNSFSITKLSVKKNNLAYFSLPSL